MCALFWVIDRAKQGFARIDTDEYPGIGKNQAARSASGLASLPARKKDSVEGRTRREKENCEERKRRRGKLFAWYHAPGIGDRRVGAKADARSGSLETKLQSG